MTKETKYISVLVFLVLLSAVFYFTVRGQNNVALGSDVMGNDYVATTTAGSAVYGAATTGNLIRAGYGTLGSVVITGANTAVFNLYNATTSNVNLRTGQKASTTILMASFPTNATAGTYVFDMQFSDGLLLDVISGSLPTSSITYR